MVNKVSRAALLLAACAVALEPAAARAQTSPGRGKAALSRGASGGKRGGTGLKAPRGKPNDAPAASPAADSLPTGAPPPPSDAPTAVEAPRAPSAPEPERAWARGVSKADQERALSLFRAGNALLKDSIFVQASEKYRQALALWGHPAIHYNLALALMNLDQPIEVHEHLVAALRYGAEPLEAEKYDYARNYKALIEKQLARVEVACDTPGAVVTLDNAVLFKAPGRYSGLVRPGAHTVGATLGGYLPSDTTRTLLPGESASLDVRLFTADDLTRYRRRWSAPMPWLVMGAGAAAVGGGALLHLQSRERYAAFDSGVTQCGGCFPSTALSAQLDQATLMQRLAFGGYAVGGAALISGAVLAYLNQPQSYRIDPGQLNQERVSLTPLVGGGGGGVQAQLRF